MSIYGNAAVIEAPVHTPVSGAGAATVVADTPGGGKVGKILVAKVSWRGIGIVTPVEAGWTEHYDFPDTVGPQLALYSRPATDTDPATFTFNFSGAAARVIATLFYISNSTNGIEVFSAESSGNSLNAIAPSVVSPGPDRVALRMWARTHTNNLLVPTDLDIFSRWNTAGTDAGAVGHVATVDWVKAGATATKTAIFDTTAREWRAVTLLVGPGKHLSKADRNMLRLSGYSGKTIADREKQRLILLLSKGSTPATSRDTIWDMYVKAGERPKIF